MSTNEEPQEKLSAHLYDRLQDAETAIMKCWGTFPDEISLQEAGFKAAGLKRCDSITELVEYKYEISKGEYFLYGAIESICGMLIKGVHSTKGRKGDQQ